MKRIVSPQEKKIQSYVHDGRNMYGESRSASIKTLRKRKATGRRLYRRSIRQKLQSTQADARVDEIPAVAQRSRRKQKRKCPDQPLVEYVENRWQRRTDYLMQKQPQASKLMLEAKRRLRKRRR